MANRGLCVYLATALVACLLLCPVAAQTTGPVSSESGEGGGSSADTKDPNAKPWKFLASPMGALDPNQWTEKTFQQFAVQESWDCKKNAKCTPKMVELLVGQTLGDGDLKALLRTKGYLVLHIANYGSGSDNRLTDAWYVYHFNDSKWTFEKFTASRIYGSPAIQFLFVHLNVQAVSIASARKQLTDALAQAGAQNDQASKALSLPATASAKDIDDATKKQLSTAGLDPDTVQGLARAEKLIQAGTISPDAAVRASALVVPNPAGTGTPTRIPIVESKSEDQFQWLGDYGVPSGYATVHYEAAVVKRTPANVANLLSVLKLLNLAQGARKNIALDATEKANIWGAGGIGSIGLPSKVTIAGYRKKAGDPLTPEERTALQIGAEGAFNDEQLYWWDASIGIPVHKIKDLNYSVDSGQVIATQVDKQSAYAFFNLMLHPVDLSNPKDNVWPRLLVGFPLSSSPWDRLFAGAGVGIPLKPLRNFQFFAGATFNRSKQPETLSPGDPATDGQLQSDLKFKVKPKFTFGINVPVLSVFDKLMGK
jgi:hypothetical protein